MSEIEYSGHIVDVLNESIFDGVITVKDGKISDVRSCPISENSGYIMPGFIDSHIHIESSLLIPSQFARISLKQGVVAVITDPHEIANVLGEEGINYMIADGKKINFHFYFGIPSSVPSTPFETSNGHITSSDVKRLLNSDEFYGLSEVMNASGVLSKEKSIMDKISFTLEAGKMVDGHAPKLSGSSLKHYIDSGITTDHESSSYSEATEKLSLGMKIQIREGSAAQNFDELFPLLLEEKYKGQLMFCTDDIYPDELLKGTIRNMVSKAIAKGMPLWNVLHAACVAPVHHYKLDCGLLSKGDNADFIIVKDLKSFDVEKTVVNGAEITESSEYSRDCAINCFNHTELSKESLAVDFKRNSMKVIGVVPNQLITDKLEYEFDGTPGYDISRDLLKIVVCNRYENKAPAIGFVHGFGLHKGAIASTVAHDCHNIIAVGTSDEELLNVINTLIKVKGGLCAVNGDAIQLLELPVAGLMSYQPAETVSSEYEKIKEFCQNLGCKMHAPFMTLSFMALPVIPYLKITDKGLFDVERFEFTSI